MSFISLGAFDIVLASLFLILNALLSLMLRLGLERQLLIAAVRMVVQLLLMGLALKMLFSLTSPWITAVAVVIMVGFAGREVMARQQRRLTGWWAYGLGTTAIMLSALLVTVLALTTQIRPDPWYDARFALPVLGMILGNTMTGVSLGLDRLTSAAVRERPAIEAQLALGQDRSQAFRGIIRDALRAGMIPTINSMAAVGLVSIPGMMTGQILAGVAPMEAVKYQLLIMFLISGGTMFGLFCAVLGGARLLSDDRHRLRLDRLRDPAN